MICTNSGCDGQEATKLMAMPPGAVNCVYVAAYCDKHAKEVLGMGGFHAAGIHEALTPEALEISGLRAFE